jgi:hypothetical protein
VAAPVVIDYETLISSLGLIEQEIASLRAGDSVDLANFSRKTAATVPLSGSDPAEEKPSS